MDIVAKCMELMMKLSEGDMDSNEMLCFGNMIVAEKR